VVTWRAFRVQGAIVRDARLLVIAHREHATGRDYWLLPGGGVEAGETPEQAVVRELREETHLEVEVERLLLDEPGAPGHAYPRYLTYLCRPLAGVARPGTEPEPEAAAAYSIVATVWLDLRDAAGWGRRSRRMR
jgi:8-oxo-dGTP diphosphatase